MKIAVKLQILQKPVVQHNNNKILGYEVPLDITFAGESVPLNRPDIYERFDREIQVNAFWHSNAILLIKRAGKWLPVIDSILIAHDIPSDFKYLAVAESGLENVVSPAKAVGYWQFLRGTAKDFGLIVNNQVDQRYNPIKSTEAAVRYLKRAYKIYNNWTLVAASYNLGMSATSKILKRQDADSYYHMVLSEEPARYIFRILAIKNMLEDPTQFGFQLEVYEKERVTNIIVINSITDWNQFCISTWHKLLLSKTA